VCRETVGSCDAFPTCTTTADCEVGSVCSTICGAQGHCIPLCDG
jgi:hypothetical protein